MAAKEARIGNIAGPAQKRAQKSGIATYAGTKCHASARQTHNATTPLMHTAPATTPAKLAFHALT